MGNFDRTTVMLATEFLSTRSTKITVDDPVLRPICSVERTITYCFGNVIGVDRLGTFQISDRAAHFENPIVGARRQAKPAHCTLQHLLAGGRRAWMPLDSQGSRAAGLARQDRGNLCGEGAEELAAVG